VSAVIIFVSTGALVYWLSRTMMLLRCSEDEITEALTGDLWRARRFLLALRSIFMPPNQSSGGT